MNTSLTQLFLCSIFSLFGHVISAQIDTSLIHVELSVVDSSDQPVFGAHVRFTCIAVEDSIYINSTSDPEGRVKITVSDSVKQCYAEVRHRDYLDVVNSELDLKNENTIYLTESIQQIDEVIVQGDQKKIVVNGDTVRYNAEKIKTETDADLGDVLIKLPNIEVDNDKIKSGEKEISGIKVNGSTVSDNIKWSAENIPANIIHRIEVIDVVSPDDPSDVSKMINVITKNPEVLYFGKVAGSYGTNNRYRAGGNIFYKNERFKISLLGDANNINKEDLLSQNMNTLFQGDNNILGAGLYMTYKPSKKTTLKFKYLFNDISRYNRTNRLQENIFDPSNYFESESKDTSSSFLNDVSFTWGQQLSKHSRLTVDFNYFLSRDLMQDNFTDLSVLDSVISYSLVSNHESKGDLQNYRSSLTYSQGVGKKKRTTLTATLNHLKQMNLNDGVIDYAYNNSSDDFTNLRESNFDNDNYSAEVSLRIPLIKTSHKISIHSELIDLSQLNSISYFNQGVIDADYSSVLSNSFQGEQLISGLTYNLSYRIRKWIIGGELGYKYVRIHNQDDSKLIDRKTDNHLYTPRLFAVRKINAFNSLNFSYSVKENISEINKMTSFTDLTIPSRIVQGNPALNVGLDHKVDVGYKFDRNKRVWHNFLYRFDYKTGFVNQSLTVPMLDTLIGDVIIGQNSQFIQYRNFSRYTKHFSRIKHDFLLKKHKFYISYGVTRENVPFETNNIEVTNNIHRFYSNLSENYTINAKFNIGLSGSVMYSIINSIPNTTHYELINWNATAFTKALLFNRLLMKVENVSFQVINLDSRNSTLANIMNLSFRLGLFENQKAALQFFIYDLLNQNQDVTYAPSTNFVLTEEKLMLRRYFLLGFAINL